MNTLNFKFLPCVVSSTWPPHNADIRISQSQEYVANKMSQFPKLVADHGYAMLGLIGVS